MRGNLTPVFEETTVEERAQLFRLLPLHPTTIQLLDTISAWGQQHLAAVGRARRRLPASRDHSAQGLQCLSMQASLMKRL